MVKLSDGWRMIDERCFIEELLVSRFNFFLGAFGALVAAALALKDQWIARLVVLFLGTIILYLLGCTIARAQVKLSTMLAELKSEPESVLEKVEAKLKRDPRPRFIRSFFMSSSSKNNLIGYVIPFLCIVILVCWFLAGLSDWLTRPLILPELFIRWF